MIQPQTAAEVVLREAKRLERLVHDLLDLARLNQHTFTVKREPLDLVAVAHEAATRYHAEGENLGVTLKISDASEASAVGDPDRILQVLSNLIENALRSTPAGGTVTVTAEPGTLTVSDSGPGIDSGDLPRAFERFYLHNRYRSKRRVGTGLGLAIVKELTEAMGGSVAVSSRPGEGTSFIVTLHNVEASAESLLPREQILAVGPAEGESAADDAASSQLRL